jgi:hypothetical protein
MNNRKHCRVIPRGRGLDGQCLAQEEPRLPVDICCSASGLHLPCRDGQPKLFRPSGPASSLLSDWWAMLGKCLCILTLCRVPLQRPHYRWRSATRVHIPRARADWHVSFISSRGGRGAHLVFCGVL